MRDLGTLGGSNSAAYSINRTGKVTGYSETSKNEHAFLYNGGLMTDIGDLLKNSLPNSFGYGINEAGHIAGTAYDSSYNGPSGFLYDGATVLYLAFGSRDGQIAALNAAAGRR